MSDIVSAELLHNWAENFSLDPERVWLNASHQGPLPNIAADAVAKMVEWKQRPHNMSTPEPFTAIPLRLRYSLASLVNAEPDDIALANSASYGLHLFANGLSLGPGDEVIVAANDFPSDILPWIRLQDEGVTVTQLQPESRVLAASEIADSITSNTRVVCLTWVHSLSGHVIDLDEIGSVCRAADVLFIVNAAQGIGGIPIDVSKRPVDGLTSVGFKYLCGPYGTGFVWIGERAAARLSPKKLYWLSALTADDLAQPQLDLSAIEVPNTAARHDVFGTANFFNFAALGECVDLVHSVGVAHIYAHNLALADRLVSDIDTSVFDVQSRGHNDSAVSAIIFLEPRHTSSAAVYEHLRAAGVDVAQRSGKLRVAPHFYNTTTDIDRLLEVLATTPAG